MAEPWGKAGWKRGKAFVPTLRLINQADNKALARFWDSKIVGESRRQEAAPCPVYLPRPRRGGNLNMVVTVVRLAKRTEKDKKHFFFFFKFPKAKP